MKAKVLAGAEDRFILQLVAENEAEETLLRLMQTSEIRPGSITSDNHGNVDKHMNCIVVLKGAK